MKIKSFFLFAVLLLLGFNGMAQPGLGEEAYEIKLPNVKGEMISLSSLKGKVVLVDFWASWCGPCRASNKKLVKLYSKYKAKGFEIFGVSVDEDNGDWKKAISKDKITWLQVNDNGGWSAKTAADWNVNAIPASFLFDKEGILYAVDYEGKALEAAIKKLLSQ
jgi:peroxiredoxin